MSSHEVSLLSYALYTLVSSLEKEIQILDETLPLSREVETRKFYIGNALLGSFLSNPESNPEDFEDREIALPLKELDGLRSVANDIQNLLNIFEDTPTE